MGDATTVLEACLSWSMFNVLIDINYFVHWNFVVFNWKIYINSGSCLVKLCNSETYEHVFSFLSVEGTGVEDCLSDVFAKRSHLWPWAWCFKTFGNDIILKTEISNICNHISKLVTFNSVFSTTWHTTVFFSNLKHFSFSSFTIDSTAFKKSCCSTHLIWFETCHV